MLVRFKSKVGGFTMFEAVALKLIRFTGHSGTVPGAIAADDLPRAMERLRAALDTQPKDPEREDEEGEEAQVSMHRRAFPLLELMQRASDEGCAITWEPA